MGLGWGGAGPTQPTGLNRAPTFSGYGWNSAVARQLSTPTLVMQGLLDGVLPPPGPPGILGQGTGKVIFNNLPQSMTNKVLVQVECASHALPWEKGAHATLKKALIEWIQKGKFNDSENGSWIVNQSGEVRRET